MIAIPSLWKVRIGGMSEGRGKERKISFITVATLLRFILFLMNWHGIKCWTRISLAHRFLNLNFWLSPSIPLKFHSLCFLIWLSRPKAMMACPNGTGWDSPRSTELFWPSAKPQGSVLTPTNRTPSYRLSALSHWKENMPWAKAQVYYQSGN